MAEIGLSRGKYDGARRTIVLRFDSIHLVYRSLLRCTFIDSSHGDGAIDGVQSSIMVDDCEFPRTRVVSIIAMGP